MEQVNYERQQLLDLECQMHAINAKVVGMVAENTLRENKGADPAYFENDFQECSNELLALSFSTQNMDR